MNNLNIFCVCRFCGEHTSSEGSLEINMRDRKIYFICPKCKKSDELDMKVPEGAVPLPRIRPMR